MQQERNGKKEKGFKLLETLFFLVTALGFKPKTFSSVVRCSIQLSYAAIPFCNWDCKDKSIFTFCKAFFLYSFNPLRFLYFTPIKA